MSVNWITWSPDIKANLMFVRDGDRVLLIRKKRGFGAGKINAPGGKIEAGETPLESAIRETIEEVGVTPIDARWAGELHFHFLDGPDIHCAVFLADAHEGIATESEEALPLWTPATEIPYHEMWADDIHWLPGLLKNKTFRAWFIFEGEIMRDRTIEWLDEMSSSH